MTELSFMAHDTLMTTSVSFHMILHTKIVEVCVTCVHSPLIVEVQVVMHSEAIMHTFQVCMRGILHSETENRKAPSTLFTSQEQTELSSNILEAKTLYNAMKLVKRVKMNEEYKNAEPDLYERDSVRAVTPLPMCRRALVLCV